MKLSNQNRKFIRIKIVLPKKLEVHISLRGVLGIILFIFYFGWNFALSIWF